MKALIATGDPAAAVEFADVAEPAADPTEVVVEVDAFSVNRGEIFALDGTYGAPAERGWLPGQDIAGRVVRAAADGSGPTVGQRVVGHPDAGGWAERVAVPVSRLGVLPDGVSAVDAATLPLAGLTALRLLREAGPVVGRRILLTGASGGVGHFVTELATQSGAEVTAVTASPQRGQQLAALGAAQVVQDLGDASGQFDIVLESVGGETFTAALSRLAPGGTVLWFGQASLTPVTLSFFDLLAVTPVTVKHFPHWISTTSDGEDLGRLVRLVASGRLHPEIGRTADWTETATVLDDLAHRRIRGNAVLTVTAR
ncbi:zinc-binding dehydrogenase [Dactylosporangium darangshiense]|uniref:Zinc-binding dehydrogenase n=1 Tax=Dactylosporangium darangshiense TaxID=579108 RepID=A0ABP8DTV5_9ACTN